MSSDLAGVADFRLDNHDGDGAVCDVAAVLQDADQMFTHLAGDEGDTWRGRKGEMVNSGGDIERSEGKWKVTHEGGGAK